MTRMPFKTFTLRERPDLEDEFERLAEASWPRFLRQKDALGYGQYWPSLYTTWADWQLVLVDGMGPTIAATHAVPLVWSGTVEDLPSSIAEILSRATADHESGRAPTVLCALAAMVDARYRGQGLSPVAVRAMVDLARVHGLGTLLAPVRPADKSAYPLAPMERYARWQNDDGLPMDRWIRVHARMGADILAVAPRTLLITGSVEEWERWTDLRFPDSGSYVVPGALQPVVIDRNADEGRYEDPNVWMRHTIE
ncbi:MAG: GNAT family N-acetyltransferase [Candidatus Rokuibacteriota bacterium]|nr:MAG: GNAT family N-acetyltransferase [Candidatus Rokubacteria bacterium]